MIGIGSDEVRRGAALEACNPALAPHRCFDLVVYEHSRNDSLPRSKFHDFVIRRTEGGEWFMFDNGVRGMRVVQCHFCGHRFFSGNEVTIE